MCTNNSDNKVYIPKDIRIGTSEEISNEYNSRNEITLTAKPNDIQTDAKCIKSIANCKQKNHVTSAHLDHPSTIKHKGNNNLPQFPLNQPKAFKRKDTKLPIS